MSPKTGYYGESEERIVNNNVSVSEQETYISFMRDEEFAIVYTSDTTQMTRLDKLCKNNPDNYSLIADTGRGKTYKIADKGLISLRSKRREISDETREARSERFKQMWADKRAESDISE